MKFKKGDRVMVKLWKDMQQSNQVHSIGKESINELLKPYSFTRVMRKYCGRMAVVELVNEEKQEIHLRFDGERMPSAYIFREWMLEPADEEDVINGYIVPYEGEDK